MSMVNISSALTASSSSMRLRVRGFGVHCGLPELVGGPSRRGLEAGDVYLRVGIAGAHFGAHLVALRVRVGDAALLAARELVERRDGGVDVAVLHQRAHIAEEEGQQQRSYMAAVDVGIGHYYDLVVAELRDVEVVAESRAEGGYDGVELVVIVDLLLAHLLDVEHLAPEREYGLESAVAPVLGAAAGAVALDDVELG